MRKALIAIIFRLVSWAFNNADSAERRALQARLYVPDPRVHGARSEPKDSGKPFDKIDVSKRFNALLRERQIMREKPEGSGSFFVIDKITGLSPSLQLDEAGASARLVFEPVKVDTIEAAQAIQSANSKALRNFASALDAPLRLEDDPADVIDAETAAKLVSGEMGYLTVDPGSAGIDYQSGLPENTEHNPRFMPVSARGLQYAHGEFHRLLLESGSFRRGWSSINHVLSQGIWRVDSAASRIDDDVEGSDELRARADKQAAWVEKQLFRKLYGGWKKFVRECNYQAVGGFSLFIEIFDAGESGEFGGLKKLSFRYPMTVQRWLVNPSNGELEYVECIEPQGREYIVKADNCLLYSFENLGNDFEGMSYSRPVVVWADIVQLLTEIEAVAGEKWGSPWVWASRMNPSLATGPNSDEKQTIRDLIRDAVAADDPVLTLPDNTKLELTSPQGSQPNFAEAKRFALERLVEIWKSEASLIAVGGAGGAYAARESAVDEQVAFATYFAGLICDGLNGANNTPHTGTIKKMIDLKFGGPPIEGEYPELVFALGEAEEESKIDSVVAASAQGLIEKTPDVIDHVHEILGLPAVVRDSQPPTPGQLPTPATPALAPMTLSEPVILSEFDAVKASAELDRAEAQLGRALARVSRSHVSMWKDRFDDERRSNEISAEEIQAFAESTRASVLSDYTAAVLAIMAAVSDKGSLAVTGELGVKTLKVDTSEALKLKAASVAEETFNRTNGLVVDRFTQFANGAGGISIPLLAPRTFENIAAKGVSVAYNSGRNAVTEEIARRASAAGLDAGQIYAERSAVMDEGTCEVCAALDGERFKYGSASYYDNAPPNKCLGWDRCRCIYTFIMPDEVANVLR